jgi:hypothetical protein
MPNCSCISGNHHFYFDDNEEIIPNKTYPKGNNKNIIPKIIELVLNKGFDILFFVFICFKYILFIAIPVLPITIKHIPIKPIKAIIIPIIAAINGRKIIKKPIKSHPL